MAEERRPKKKTNIVVWIVLGLLILALGGFGIGGFGGSLSSVASVGNRDITVQEYANAVQGEQRRLQAQTGQPLTLQQMQQFGIDLAVMQQLLTSAALEEEAARLGVSVGDAEVARRIRTNPGFGGLDGNFDREAYSFQLDRLNLSEQRFERQIRNEAARELVQAAVVSGVEVPSGYTDTLLGWLAETRDATLITVTVSDLTGGPLAPSADDIQAFYDANPEMFERPERRAITYAWKTPETVDVEIDEDALREMYEARADIFRQPPRVLAERLAFANDAAAEAALAAIDAGETTFATLVEDRGLTLADVDQGELARDDLDEAVADALFALEEPGLVGPLPTSLGPALYRVNAVLDATETPYEDVRDDLAREFTRDAARRQIDGSRDAIDDLLAGGATLEELADETEMTLGTIEWSRGDTTGIAAYDNFRAAAASVTEDDFPELEGLSDGGIFALRLDRVIPPAVSSLDEVRDDVAAAWSRDSLRTRLLARAEEIAADDADSGAGTPETLTGITRDAVLENTPPAVVDRLFEAEAGDVFAIEGDDVSAFVVRLDSINDADLEDENVQRLRQAIETQARQDLSGDIFDAYARSVQGRIGFNVDQRAVEAVQAQLLGGG